MLKKTDAFLGYIKRIFRYFLPHRKQRSLKTIFYKVVGKSDVSRWKLQTNLYADWEDRTAVMSQWIPENSSIMEFGCGNMALKKYLPSSCQYFPSDLVSRDSDTFLVDLNQSLPLALPKQHVYFFSGVLEYIYDLERLIQASAKSCQSMILSYAPYTGNEADSILERRAEGWVNDYSREEIISLVNKYGFSLIEQKKWQGQWLFSLELTN